MACEGIGPERAEAIVEWFADEDEPGARGGALAAARGARGGAAAGRPADRAAVRDHRDARGLQPRAGEGGARGARREGLGLRLEEDDRRHRRREPGLEGREGARRPACRSSARPTCRRCSPDERDPAERSSAPRLECAARIVTNRSWAARAAHDETGLPFSSTANTTVLRIRPDSVQARSVVPVLPFTWPRSAGRRSAERPAHAGDGQRADERGPDRRVRRAGPDHADERVGREAIEAREPGAVDHADALDRDPRLAHRRDHEPRRRPPTCPTLPAAAGELLEQHLGVEVVALVVHVADDRRERVGDVRGERRRASGARRRGRAARRP